MIYMLMNICKKKELDIILMYSTPGINSMTKLKDQYDSSLKFVLCK